MVYLLFYCIIMFIFGYWTVVWAEQVISIWALQNCDGHFSLFSTTTQEKQLNHRAPSVGLFLLGLSAALCISHPSCSYLTSIQREAEWAGEVLAPALVTFDFLWLSEDHNTAHILLCGSCLLLGVCDWLSADAVTLMTRCLGLSSLSCCLTVCLFASNALGAFGGVALSLPLLVAQRVGTNTFAPLLSPAATEGLTKWLLKGSMSVGCWASTQALSKFLLYVTDQCQSNY